MPRLDRVIDRIIQNAIAKGDFDNLRGKGKPLNLHENQLAAPEWRMAFLMLEQEGFALPQMEDRKAIEKEFKHAREALARTRRWRVERLAEGENSPLVEGEWRQAVVRFSEAAGKLNKRIDAYNLQIPADIFYRPRINPTREIDEVVKRG